MMLMISTSKRYNLDAHVVRVDTTFWKPMFSIRAPSCYLWGGNYSVTFGLNWTDAHVANVDVRVINTGTYLLPLGKERLCRYRVKLDGRPRRQCGQCGRHSLDTRVVNTGAYLLPLEKERLCRYRVKLDGLPRHQCGRYSVVLGLN